MKDWTIRSQASLVEEKKVQRLDGSGFHLVISGAQGIVQPTRKLVEYSSLGWARILKLKEKQHYYILFYPFLIKLIFIVPCIMINIVLYLS